ncbi:MULTISPECIES: hypothetical protein [Methanosarcina]|uniref:hypothetical protein n=1 Tax=Methanosarcina TaxID=2207 RepID=UPI0015B3B2B7|nr:MULTISPECIES: hypothetical protein [Methanosarcina]
MPLETAVLDPTICSKGFSDYSPAKTEEKNKVEMAEGETVKDEKSILGLNVG